MSAQLDFFDTTRLSPSELRDATAVARDQNAKVLAIFRRMRRPLSPSQVWRIGCDEGEAWLLTSVRRSMTVLTHGAAPALVKLETKREGVYGRPEYMWSLAACQNGT